MEIKEFEIARNSKLTEFQEKYRFLKQEYSSTVLAAINEKDGTKQQELVSRVLSINADLSNELRQIISEIYKGSEFVPSKTIEELTEDLIRYQKEYSDIEKGKDRLQTLKLINSANTKRLTDATNMFNIYLGVLIFLIALVSYLVFRTDVRSVYNKVTSTISSTPTT